MDLALLSSGEFAVLKSAVWFTSWACNFKCSYCWEYQLQQRGELAISKNKSAEEWIEVWNRLRPEVLDISGGEPFTVPGIEDVMAAVPSRIAVTTNLSVSPKEFCRKVDPAKVIVVTASFHPTQNGTSKNPMNVETFLGRALMLKRRGYPVRINFVATHEHVWLLEVFKLAFGHHGLDLNVAPYSSVEDPNPLPFTPEESAEVLKWATESARTHPLVAEIDSVSPGAEFAVDCSGGIEHISVQPDGSAYRCLTESIPGHNPLGNVFDPDFQLKGGPPCWFLRGCTACDRDKVRVSLAEIRHS